MRGSDKGALGFVELNKAGVYRVRILIIFASIVYHCLLAFAGVVLLAT
jgi:hypothetical protein